MFNDFQRTLRSYIRSVFLREYAKMNILAALIGSAAALIAIGFRGLVFSFQGGLLRRRQPLGQRIRYLADLHSSYRRRIRRAHHLLSLPRGKRSRGSRGNAGSAGKPREVDILSALKNRDSFKVVNEFSTLRLVKA